MKELAAAVLVVWPVMIGATYASPGKTLKGYIVWVPVVLSLALAALVLW